MVPENPLQNLLEIIGNTADAFTTALLVRKPGADKWELAAHFSLSRNFDSGAAVQSGDGMIGQVARSGQMVSEEFSDDSVPDIEIYKTAEPLKALLVLPVKGDTLLGVLYLDTKEQFGFPTKTQKMLGHFTDQLAWHLQQERNSKGSGTGNASSLMGNRFLPVLVRSVEDEIFDEDRTLSLLQLDVTNLKPVPRGQREAVLGEIGESLSRILPKPKLLFQSTETALAILLVNCDLVKARALEPEINSTVQLLYIQVSGKPFLPKFQLTSAEHPSGAEGLNDLLRMAKENTATTQEKIHA